MARQGFVVFTWDMVGWNDSKQIPHEFGLSPREQIWGFGPLGLQLWNSTRALDFLQSLSDVDPERIAMTGASGGRIAGISADGGGREGEGVGAGQQGVRHHAGRLSLENATNLRLETYNVEIAAMMAPRPMLIVSTPEQRRVNDRHD